MKIQDLLKDAYKEGMTLEEMILYLADYMEETRIKQDEIFIGKNIREVRKYFSIFLLPL